MYNKQGSRLWWFARLLDDSDFAALMNCRWKYYRERDFTEEKVRTLIDEAVAEMGDAVERNHYVWKTIGRYVWPNFFVGDTYEEEVEYLEDWIIRRIHWMDINLPGDCDSAINAGLVEDGATLTQTKLYPNPTNGTFNVANSAGLSQVQVTDMQGRTLLISDDLGDQVITEFSLKGVPTGLYFVRVSLANGEITTHKLVVD
jgi:hypothetical protein